MFGYNVNSGLCLNREGKIVMCLPLPTWQAKKACVVNGHALAFKSQYNMLKLTRKKNSSKQSDKKLEFRELLLKLFFINSSEFLFRSK